MGKGCLKYPADEGSERMNCRRLNCYRLYLVNDPLSCINEKKVIQYTEEYSKLSAPPGWWRNGDFMRKQQNWNMEYTGWEEIYVPRPTIQNSTNPHQMLDYIRFISDSAVSFCKIRVIF